MLSLVDRSPRLCDGLSRREFLRAGSLGMASVFGLSAVGSGAPSELPGKSLGSFGKAKRCIVLFLMGGPPQHSTWDPKPLASEEIRGAYGPISTSVPGTQICELLPRTSQLMHHVALLRAVSTGDNAHSSSGYAMLTGQPHQPLNFENANPGPPNDWPMIGAVLQHLRRGPRDMPPAVRLPHHIFNTDRSVWPGQTSGFLGASADPWLFRCEPASTDFQPPEYNVGGNEAMIRLQGRKQLLAQLDESLRTIEQTGATDSFNDTQRQAFELLTSNQSKTAFRLDQEPDVVRDRYGRGQFGQSTLLARRLVEAGVTFVQVNWFRGADEPDEAPCWDSHADETARLKNVLVPPFDQAYSALLTDLIDRGMLDDTLVVCMSEFGRSPKFNARGGRDHWGTVFSLAMAGGGVQGGVVHGASDKHAAYPQTGIVRPQDVAATIYHCFGYAPTTEIRDRLGRPLAISRGEVVREALI
ncbi:MAG: DUF1501 domain-containing protein [Planctomycetales bacterium]|nr:DUF1501 domain-containing protein [Planctomycetales bacterium]